MQQQPIRIPLQQTTACVCGVCGNNTFREAVLLRSVPGILIGSTTSQYMPLPVFECAACGAIHQDSLAPEIKEVLETPKQKDAIVKPIQLS